jgi:hypothetical protein
MLNKKVSELSINEMLVICDNHPGCKDCPMLTILEDGYNLCLLSMLAPNSKFLATLNREVELDKYFNTDSEMVN